MTGRSRRPQAGAPDGSWLAEVARSACRDVGDVPVELLGDYLPLLADAATSGRRPDPAELDAVGLLGRRAAELGVSAGSAVQLYLSAARRLWQQLPAVVRSRDSEVVRAAAAAVLHVVDEAVAQPGRGIQRRPPADGAVGGDPAPGVHRGPAARRRRRGHGWWSGPSRSASTWPGRTRSRWPRRPGRLNDGRTGDQRPGTRRRAVGRRPRRPGGHQGRLDRRHHPGRHRRARAAHRAEDARRPHARRARALPPRPAVARHRRDGPTRAPTASPGPTKRPARAWPWPCGCAWTAP